MNSILTNAFEIKNCIICPPTRLAKVSEYKLKICEFFNADASNIEIIVCVYVDNDYGYFIDDQGHCNTLIWKDDLPKQEEQKMIQITDLTLETSDFIRGFNACLQAMQTSLENKQVSADQQIARDQKLLLHTQGLVMPSPDEITGCITCGKLLIKEGIALWLAMHGG